MDQTQRAARTPEQIEQQLQDIAKDSAVGTGLWYELYEQNLNTSVREWIDGEQDPEQKKLIESIATERYGYEPNPSGTYVADIENSDLIFYPNDTAQALQNNHEQAAYQAGYEVMTDYLSSQSKFFDQYENRQLQVASVGARLEEGIRPWPQTPEQRSYAEGPLQDRYNQGLEAGLDAYGQNARNISAEPQRDQGVADVQQLFIPRPEPGEVLTLRPLTGTEQGVAEQGPPDIATASTQELREYMQGLETRAQQVGPGNVKYADLADDIDIIYNALLDRAQGLPVNDSDRRVLLGLPTQEVLARVYGEAEETARETLLDRFQVRREGEAGYESTPAQAEQSLRLYQEQNPGVSYQQLLKEYDEGMAFHAAQPPFDHPAIQQGVSAEPQQDQSLTAGATTQQENEASFPDTLRSRYASLQSEISAVDAKSPGEAVAATNYFRGRAEELNYTRDLLLREDQSVPSMDIEQIQIGCSQGREQGHELGIG